MSYAKAWIVTLILLMILTGAFYTNVIESIVLLVSGANTGFIALLPPEAIAVISIIMFWILIWLAYAFLRE